jgi:hypothetical protein
LVIQEKKMRQYSLYLMEPGRRVGRPLDFDCENDQAAVEKAVSLQTDFLLELWQGTRLVLRIEAAPRET